MPIEAVAYFDFSPFSVSFVVDVIVLISYYQTTEGGFGPVESAAVLCPAA